MDLFSPLALLVFIISAVIIVLMEIIGATQIANGQRRRAHHQSDLDQVRTRQEILERKIEKIQEEEKVIADDTVRINKRLEIIRNNIKKNEEEKIFFIHTVGSSRAGLLPFLFKINKYSGNYNDKYIDFLTSPLWNYSNLVEAWGRDVTEAERHVMQVFPSSSGVSVSLYNQQD